MPSTCANWSPGGPDCGTAGKFTCSKCLLVAYCGASCQRAHWPHHKVECKSPLAKEDWRPQWESRGQPPKFMGGPIVTAFGGKKYFWGNVPAIDVVKLDKNEGASFQGPLHLLFAASGDIRNVIKSITGFPDSFKGTVQVTLNDRDMDIVARNLILLLICLAEDDETRAVESIIHIWYSALLTEDCVAMLHGQAYRLVEEMCEKIEHKMTNNLLGKTWNLGRCSLRTVLTKSQWMSLPKYFQIPKGLTKESASDLRQATMLAPERVDYLERRLFAQKPYTRVCMLKFRKDGILLPFGQSRKKFSRPNPTFYHDTQTWPLYDSSDPLDSYNLSETCSTSAGPATNDIYGKLLCRLRESITLFHRRVRQLNVTFRLFALGVEELCDRLGDERFSRIEVSNITDRGYVGTGQVLALFIHRLQPRSVNPCATLISLYMNAVEEDADDEHQLTDPRVEKLATWYMKKHLRPPRGRYDASLLLFANSLTLFRDQKAIFERYAQRTEFKKLAEICEATSKDEHTIVDKWPAMLKLKPGDAGAQEEFDRLLGSDLSGSERYIEWIRLR